MILVAPAKDSLGIIVEVKYARREFVHTPLGQHPDGDKPTQSSGTPRPAV
jgi:hypothetical protein